MLKGRVNVDGNLCCNHNAFLWGLLVHMTNEATKIGSRKIALLRSDVRVQRDNRLPAFAQPHSSMLFPRSAASVHLSLGAGFIDGLHLLQGTGIPMADDLLLTPRSESGPALGRRADMADDRDQFRFRSSLIKFPSDRRLWKWKWKLR